MLAADTIRMARWESEKIRILDTFFWTPNADHQSSGAQRELGRNVHAVWRRVPHEVSDAECRRFGSARCRGAAGADGKPPTASSSERAGGDRHVVSSGICRHKVIIHHGYVDVSKARTSSSPLKVYTRDEWKQRSTSAIYSRCIESTLNK
jgi:hypothetical protein